MMTMAAGKEKGRDRNTWNERAMSDDFSAPDAVSHIDLVVALGGFEGPIELLLNLARAQKVDLSKIAILPLAEQYLAFIESAANRLRIEIAADYLVMAAWLAYLKSRLVLPEHQQKNDQTETALMADALRFQLQWRKLFRKRHMNWGSVRGSASIFLCLAPRT
jgi:segregation and condensation protein A